MAIELNYENTQYKTDLILWDRDSFFIDFENYWLKLAGQIAQLISEKTTKNWDKFNVVRNHCIKMLGINPENEKCEFSSPIKILPTSFFHSLISSSLINIIENQTLDDLNKLTYSLTNEALNNNKENMKACLKKIELLKDMNPHAKQILITNDSKENHNVFLKESGLENIIYKSFSNMNKTELGEHFNKSSVFITSNLYLCEFYKNKNVLLIENVDKLVWKEISDNSKILIHIDGASRGNPGPSSVGIAFFKEEDLIDEVSEYIGEKTNNFAEYTALIRALEISLSKGYKNILIKSDSELVVKQIKKEYKVKDADIRELFDKANSLINQLTNFEIMHVRREENLKADKLANLALK